MGVTPSNSQLVAKVPNGLLHKHRETINVPRQAASSLPFDMRPHTDGADVVALEPLGHRLPLERRARGMRGGGKTLPWRGSKISSNG